MSFPATNFIDTHVHIVGNGSSGSGCWLNLKSTKYLLGRYMVRHMGLPASSLTGDLDRLYVDRLLEFVRGSTLTKIVILAHENVYDSQGRIVENFGSFYVPNDYVLKLAKDHPEFLPAVSIHPGRADALDELEKCIALGAVMMKCLPNCHNIECSDPRFTKFWERMAAAGLPLLAHTGGELSVPVMNRALQDPTVLTLPLECGVKVIAAHCATSSGPFDRNYIDTLIAMTKKYPHLYCDNSALASPLRSVHLRKCLGEDLKDRIVHGSDLPIPVSGLWLWLRGLIDYGTYRTWEKQDNILERDFQLKKAMGFSEETFTRLNTILKGGKAAT
jgi:uncharacterized protein